MANNIEFVVGFDGGVLRKNVADSIAELEKFNKSADKMRKSIEDAAGAGNKMKQLQAAVTDLGGAGKLTGDKLEAVQRVLGRLVAAGHAVPAEFKAMAASMQAAQQSASALGAAQHQVAASAQAMASQLGPLGGYLAALGPIGLAAAAGLALVGGAIVSATQAFVAHGSALADLSSKTALSTTALQEYAYAGSLVGVSQDAISNSVIKASVNIAQGSQATQAALGGIGLSVSQLRSLKPEDQFRQIASAIASIADPGQQAAAAVAVFGKSGKELLPLIRSDFAAAADEAHRLGAVMSEEMVGKADAAGDAATRLGAAWDGFLNRVVMAVVPLDDITRRVEQLAQLAGSAGITAPSGGMSDTYNAIERIAFLPVTAPVELAKGMLDLNTELSVTIPRADAATAALMRMGRAMVSGAPDTSSLDKAFAGALVAGEQAAKEMEAEQKKAADAAKKHADEIARLRAQYSGLSAQGDMNKLAQAFQSLDGVAPQMLDDMGRAVEALVEKGAQLPAVFAPLQEFFKPSNRADIQALLKGSFARAGAPTAAPVGVLDSATQRDLFGLRDLDKVINPSLGLWTRYGDVVEQEMKNAGAAVEEVAGKTTDWGHVLAGVADMFQVLGISADSALGRILGGVTSVMASFQNLQKLGKDGKLFGEGGAFSTGEGGGMSTFGGKMEVGAAVGGGLASIGQMLGGANTTAGRSLGGAAMGAQLGAVAGPWGIAAGAVIGGIIGAFKKPSWIKVGKDAGKVLGMAISKELAQAIEAQSKKLGISTKNAALLNITGAMGESGKDPRQFASQITSLMQAIKSGAVPAAEGVKQLGESFSAVADAALKAGSVGDKALVGLIKSSRELGLDSPEIKAFVGEQLGRAAGGVSSMQGIGVHTEADAKAQAVIFSSAFWATVKEQGILKAGDAFKESFAKLTESLTGAGFDVSGILGPVGDIIGLSSNEVFRGAIEGAEGLREALEGIANAGYLTTESFSAFQQQAGSAYAQAIEGGASSAQALQAIAPLLQSLQSAAGNYGINLDASTQALIDQAKAAGVAFKTEPVERMAQGIDRLVIAMEKLAGISGDVAGSFDSMGTSLGGVPNMPGGEPEFSGGIKGYASGGYIPPRPGGTIVRIGEGGEGEFVTPKSKAGGGLGGATIMLNADINVEVPPGGMDPRSVAQAMVVALRDNLEGLKFAVAGA